MCEAFCSSVKSNGTAREKESVMKRATHQQKIWDENLFVHLFNLQQGICKQF